MGLVYANLTLSNARDASLAPLITKALVDTGTLHLCIPEHVVMQLSLEELERREVTLADGAKHIVPYVGPIKVQFGNRSCYTGAMMLGDDVLLGTIPMEDMDLVVRPSMQDVVANPQSPNIPASIAKSMIDKTPSDKS